ncbi:hypothetical protein ACHAWF_000450, partial [Thalassiosira exigua]
ASARASAARERCPAAEGGAAMADVHPPAPAAPPPARSGILPAFPPPSETPTVPGDDTPGSSDGRTYVGDWSRGGPHGKGELWCDHDVDGYVYAGDFRSGKKDGGGDG